MGKVILVSDVLTEQMIRAGEAIVKRLDLLPVIVDDVFWYRRSEEVDWKLVLAMPGLSFYGPLVGYGHVESLLLSIPGDVLIPDLDQIALLDTNVAPVQALRHSLKAPFQRSQYGLNKVWLERVYFEGFYIYRLTDTVQMTCTLFIDPEIASSLEGHQFKEGSAYVSAEGFPSIDGAAIIAHGSVKKVEENFSIEIEMPVKYRVQSCGELRCRATGTVERHGWEQESSVYINHVKLTPA